MEPVAFARRWRRPQAERHGENRAADAVAAPGRGDRNVSGALVRRPVVTACGVMLESGSVTSAQRDPLPSRTDGTATAVMSVYNRILISQGALSQCRR